MTCSKALGRKNPLLHDRRRFCTAHREKRKQPLCIGPAVIANTELLNFQIGRCRLIQVAVLETSIVFGHNPMRQLDVTVEMVETKLENDASALSCH